MNYDRVGRSLLGLTVVCALFTTGCASVASSGASVTEALRPDTRFIEQPTEVVPLEFEAASGEVAIEIETMIPPEGPGSWLHEADWDEYVITIENRSEDPLTVSAVHLVDPRGMYVEPGTDTNTLKLESKSLAEAYAEQGLHVAKYVGYGSVAIAGQLAAYGFLGTTAMVAAPAVLLAAPAYYVWKRSKQKDDQSKVDYEFRRRLLSPPLLLAGRGRVTGSFYFPIVPSPQAFVLTYDSAKLRDQSLQIDLRGLQGLHVATGNSVGE